ncbi:hypothetical protein AGR56_05210 [Clostridium sp. DMHC 10]|nr:hypothetical protein AGR56_05210 [Clostridium sp. DMHC 10]
MYDLISKHKEYIIGDKRIIWFWDEDNHSVKELKVNNLCICDSNYKELWNMRQILICDDSCVCVNLLDYSKSRKMKKVIYHDLECRLNTYNRQKFLTLENDKDWEKSCKLGFSEPHYGLWGLVY